MNFLKRASLSILTSILLWAAWPAGGFAPLLFIAFTPLLGLQELIQIEKKGKAGISFFWYSWLSMIVFNLLTTWWIWYASPGGMLLAVIANALFMAMVLQLFHITKVRLGTFVGYLSLIFYWITYEYIHHRWELSWPWLSLGNGFAAWCDLVQWYEYTGILGGTMWVLITNCITAFFICKFISTKKFVFIRLCAIYMAPILLLPAVVSGIIKGLRQEKKNPISVVVVQPNIDPYTEKFSGMSSNDQLNKMLDLAAQKINDDTDYLIFPETALPDGIWENELDQHRHIKRLKEFISSYPKLRLVTGVASNRYYATKNEASATARQLGDSPGYYDSYNTAIQISSDSVIPIYHKSKLVLGVERIPFSGLFGLFEKFAIDLGGASGSLGTQPTPSVFRGKANVAPVICYESIYGEYITEYIKQGANVIFIMTNDGWWRDTPGYRQHCQYARLRAIETRRPIARSANTGTSCFIDQQGEVLQPTSFWTPAVISQKIQLNNAMTFYTRHGDYIGKFAIGICIISIVVLAVYRRKNKTT